MIDKLQAKREWVGWNVFLNIPGVCGDCLKYPSNAYELALANSLQPTYSRIPFSNGELREDIRGCRRSWTSPGSTSRPDDESSKSASRSAYIVILDCKQVLDEPNGNR
jgi:hypothetical protein